VDKIKQKQQNNDVLGYVEHIKINALDRLAAKRRVEQRSFLARKSILSESDHRLLPEIPDPEEPEVVDSETYNIPVGKSLITREITRTVKELFGGKKFKFGELFEKFRVPSTSSHYNSSRSNMGALGELVLDDDSLTSELNIRQPGGYYQPPSLLVEDLMDTPGVDFESFSLEAFGELRTSGYVLQNSEELDENLAYLSVRIYDLAKTERARGELLLLPEALKMRCISKGTSSGQTALRPLQKFLHGTLRQHPVFSLIGEPISRDRMMSQLGPLRPGEIYLSGDYASATDRLFTWTSNEVADSLCDVLELNMDVRNLVKNYLTGHLISCTDADTKSVLEAEQQRGQLMGSIISFPVLCIVNAAISRCALEIARGETILLRDIPMLINGDDITMRGPKSIYNIWSLVLSQAGLEESVGKTYVSDRFVNMNSRSFVYTPENTYFLTQVPFINMGLLGCVKGRGEAVNVRDPVDPRGTIGSLYRELLKSLPQNLVGQVHDQFIHLNRDVLASAGNTPWYVPEQLGGLGLTGYKYPSDLDRKILFFYLHRNGKKKLETWPAAEANFKMWSLAAQRCRRVKTFKTNDPDLPGVKAYDDMVSKVVKNLLFESRDVDGEMKAIPMHTSMIEKEANTGPNRGAINLKKQVRKTYESALAHNQKFWARSSYQFDLEKFPMLPLDELESTRRYEALITSDEEAIMAASALAMTN
jgi:hypothetical protein